MEKKIIACVLAVIRNEKGEVLFQLRNDPGTEAHDKWELPGGGMEYGEDPEQAVIREVKEETGYDVEVVRLLPKVYSNIWPEAQVILICYECKIVGGEHAKQDIEVTEARFVDPGTMDYTNSLPKLKEIVDLLKQ